MESSSFLLVNDQPIFINQAVKYLQASGKLAHFIGDILRQYVIEQEIQRRDDIEISPGLTEQTIIDFRINNHLNDHQIFQEWLQKNGTDYTTFYESIAFGFKLEKLKVLITETKITEYFIERKIFLDRLIVSRIVVENREIAEELQTQIEEGGSFEQLAREYSLTEDRILNGMMGLVSRGTMPHQLRAVIDMANPGQVVGPIEMEGRYGLFRVEQFLPASLEDIQIKQALENELFEKWLVEKIQKLTVKVQMS